MGLVGPTMNSANICDDVTEVHSFKYITVWCYSGNVKRDQNQSSMNSFW